jgi:hypothetical protein
MVEKPDNSIALADLLPNSLGGWDAENRTPLHTPKDLYNYIDGGAELYLSYGFNEALSYTYQKAGYPDVLADIYDLAEPRNAFGVFTQTREQEDQRLGQGCFSIPGALFFWKGPFYISLSAQESTSDTEDFMRDLGTCIDKNISQKGKVPEIVEYLPSEGLIPAGYVYFHHYVWLNSYFFISDDNLLFIDDSTDAILAKYTGSSGRLFMLLIEYPNQTAAGMAFTSFSRSFFPEGLPDHCIRLEDNTWMAAATDLNLIAAVFNGNGKEEAIGLLNRTLEKYNMLHLHKP